MGIVNQLQEREKPSASNVDAGEKLADCESFCGLNMNVDHIFASICQKSFEYIHLIDHGLDNERRAIGAISSEDGQLFVKKACQFEEIKYFICASRSPTHMLDTKCFCKSS